VTCAVIYGEDVSIAMRERKLAHTALPMAPRHPVRLALELAAVLIALICTRVTCHKRCAREIQRPWAALVLARSLDCEGG
jgi:hypothetical protein